MLNGDHLTDRDIVLLVDGEHQAARQREAREHLDACWSCRTRMAEIEGTIAEFVHAYHDSLDSQLPPAAGPRALFRAQLENCAPAMASRTSGWLFAGQRASIAASLMVACLAVFAISQRTGDLSIPKNSLTPGETRTVSIGDVCSGTPRESATVPGGASSIRNLWLQPYSAVWNAHVKDELEDRLHGLVCAGEVDLATAQREISRDWIGAYKKYFHTDKPF
jgi:hypothetical protein